MGSLDSLDCYVNASGCFDVFRARMQLGLVSREGWSVVDDSRTALWDGDAAWPWRRARHPAPAPATLDLYVFGHGRDYRRALGDFVKLAGPVPIKPWRAHGVWHSRCMPMSEPLMHEVVANYRQYALPLNMFVFDYGWHVGPYDPANVTTCAQVQYPIAIHTHTHTHTHTHLLTILLLVSFLTPFCCRPHVLPFGICSPSRPAVSASPAMAATSSTRPTFPTRSARFAGRTSSSSSSCSTFTTSAASTSVSTTMRRSRRARASIRRAARRSRAAFSTRRTRWRRPSSCSSRAISPRSIIGA